MQAKFVQKSTADWRFSWPCTMEAMYVPSEMRAVRSSSEPEPSVSTALSLAVVTTGRPSGMPVAAAASAVT